MATARFCRRGAHSSSLSHWERVGVRVFRRNRAFTLLELLIAMGLTLLLVLAIGQFYTIVVASVRDGRALIEMGSDLRNAVKQLRDDLTSVTARMEPPGDNTNDQGCFEIIEGPANDADPDGDGNSNAAIVGNSAVGPMLGDLDDILTFTIRSSGTPFVGRYLYYREQSQTFQVKTVESHQAEVVWFTTFKDVNGDGLYQPDEPRFLVRRMFLVAPNLPGWEEIDQNTGNLVVHPGELVDPVIADPAQYAVPNNIPWNVFHYNDVSMAAPYTPATLTVPSGTAVAWRCNSLSTLTRRENRFVHLDLDLSNGSQNGLQNGNNWLPYPLMVNLTDLRNVPNSLLYFTLQGNKTGEDLILPNMLAFDVRVYDPQAPLRGDAPDVVGVAPDTSQTTDDAAGVLQPGDPGYIQAIVNSYQIAGFGAYVDLWYNRALAPQFINQPTALPNSVFSWAPDSRCLPPAYRHDVMNYPPQQFRDTGGRPLVCSWDIWSTYYERDGNNQDSYADMITDEGTNGQDDDGVNGVDDPGEYETHPPYPSWIGNNGADDDADGTIDEAGSNAQDEQALPRPAGSPLLRGIQVRIRLYEVGTRQTQQSTVIADFLDE